MAVPQQTSGATGAPSDALLADIEARATEMAREAGSLLAGHFGGGKLEVEFKDKNERDPVTNADKETQEYLWSAIKKHPQLGVEAVGENPEIGAVEREIILDHHETLDGAGYPAGKSGSDLGLPARVAAIANTFDRHTTDIVYRDARPAVDVLPERNRERNGHVPCSGLSCRR